MLIHRVKEGERCRYGLNLGRFGWRLMWPWFWGDVVLEWMYGGRRFTLLSEYKEKQWLEKR